MKIYSDKIKPLKYDKRVDFAERYKIIAALKKADTFSPLLITAGIGGLDFNL